MALWKASCGTPKDAITNDIQKAVGEEPLDCKAACSFFAQMKSDEAMMRGYFCGLTGVAQTKT